MRIIYIAIFYSAVLILAACSKDNTTPALPDGSVTFKQAAGKDTLFMPLSIVSDSVIVLGLNATLSDQPAAADHWVNFAVDTTKINAFRSKYGEAVLLPYSSYLFYKQLAKIAAGETISDSVKINIVQETLLKPYTTYVLPIVIQSVDGKQEGAASSRVLYLVFKTGKPLFISKDSWTIAGNSSYYSNFLPTNILDANTTTTYWTSNITLQMPQWIAINLGTTVTFSAVKYSVPTALKYPTLGGYPTSIQIETSMDGTTWVSNGIFAGNIANNTQTIDTGLLTAKYLRFTALACVKYSNTYSCIFISDISLVP